MDTIFALSSGPVPAGVAVVRVSGPLCFEAVAQICPAAPLKPRTAALRALRDPADGALIDTGLLLIFPSPRSFTGEDCAELQVHGSRAVITAISDVLVALGLRPAEPGEFTRRAFLNDKLSLTQVEGLGDVLQAETRQQMRLAQMQTTGALSAQYDAWRSSLTALRAELEAELDFSDEELPPGLLDKVRGDIVRFQKTLAEHQDANHAAERVRGGIKVVIAGPPNAGKSTLLNHLARRDVAIVSEEAGTTRDSLEVHLDLEGYPVTVVDTAGLRETTSAVEREGISRAKGHLASADIIVSMSAPGLQEAGLNAAADLRVFNKTDLVQTIDAPDGWLPVSLQTGHGCDAFLEALSALVKQRFSWGDHVVTGHARHQAALRDAGEALETAHKFLAPGHQDVVLAAEHLRSAAHHLARVVGRTDVEEVLGAIFSSFCIGK